MITAAVWHSTFGVRCSVVLAGPSSDENDVWPWLLLLLVRHEILPLVHKLIVVSF